MFVSGLIAAAILFATPARADYTVCDYLDMRPTPAGVEDLIGMGVVGNEWTPEYTGKFIADQVITYCPRHLLTLQAFLNKWQRKTYA